jgi:hypothetical protein
MVIKVVCKVLSELGDKYGIGGTIVFAVASMRPGDAFAVALIFYFTVAFYSAQKLYYKEPRPYFLTD